ncbi:MAG: ethanolamine permease [Myxococcota bacterium]
MSAAPEALKKTLGPLMLWGLGVGYVISGEYFGWNLGLPLGGTYGMLAATLVVTALYVAFILSYAELACAIPRAGGAFVYAERAFGPFVGFLTGLAQAIEFVFAPPAIAMAIAAYIHQRYGGVDERVIATGAYVIFTGLNIWGVRQAAAFELVVTVLAVGELLLFVGVVGPHFSLERFSADPLPNGWSGAAAAVPFAVWFYLGIEGVANAAEEARDPARDVARGFGASILTLVGLALLVFFAAVGVDGWRSVVYAPGSTEPSDAPLPLALAHVVDPGSPLYTLLLGVGLLGLIASFHGILMAAGRATMELGREQFLPKIFGHIDPRTQTPAIALLANSAIGVLAIWVEGTQAIITLSCFGALALYAISMLSLFRLRRIDPGRERPYRAIAYPWLPAIALVLSALAFVVMAVTNAGIAAVFGGILILGALLFRLFFSRKAAL